MQPEDSPDIKVFWVPFLEKRYEASQTLRFQSKLLNKTVYHVGDVNHQQKETKDTLQMSDKKR